IDHAFFSTGKNFRQILEIASDKMGEYKSNYEKVMPSPAEMEFYKKQLEHEIQVLAVMYINCGDCIQYIPVIAKIASFTDKIKLKIFLKSDYPSLPKKFAFGDDERLPAIIFYSKELVEYGRWIERPLETYRLLVSIKEVLIDDPEVQKEFKRMRVEQEERLLAAAVSEITAIIEKINAIFVLEELYTSSTIMDSDG
ncbi:MAG: thioredoxin family protein, partial [Candidatus Hodarchaeales archaeon]